MATGGGTLCDLVARLIKHVETWNKVLLVLFPLGERNNEKIKILK